MAQTPTIVNLNAVVTSAPAASQLQQSGAMVSVGGTTLSTNAYQYCATLAQVSAILGASGNHAELLTMATTFFAQGTAVGIYVLELGTNTSLNAQIAALNTWITNNPYLFYAFLVPANWDSLPAPAAAPTLTATAGGSLPQATYFAKIAYTDNSGNLIGVLSAEASLLVSASNVLVVASPPALTGATGWMPYVSTAAGTETAQSVSPVAIASNWTMPNTGLIAGVAQPLTLPGLCANYSSATGRTYFFITSSTTNIAAYPATAKAAFVLVPSPTAAGTEFQTAAAFYDWLVNNPSAASPAAPMAFRYQFGVTPWALNNNQTAINNVLTAYGNLVLTGAEGGISTACLFKGTTMDGAQSMWWYGIDYLLTQAKIQIAAALIAASNSGNPIYYRQSGINRLLAVIQDLCTSAASFGLLESAVPSATPFTQYIAAHPNDYAAGLYNGFAVTATGQNGFLTITFNLFATQFVG